MNKFIYLIVGPSGVGKTTIVDFLEKKYGLRSIRSYTDRPARFQGEDGHIFLTSKEFDELPPLCSYTEFCGHRYGVTSEQIDNHNLFVVDIAGVEYFHKHYFGEKKPFVFGLTANEKTLRDRMKKRGDSVEQIESRIANDKKEFSDLPLLANFSICVDNTNSENIAAIIDAKICTLERCV